MNFRTLMSGTGASAHHTEKPSPSQLEITKILAEDRFYEGIAWLDSLYAKCLTEFGEDELDVLQRLTYMPMASIYDSKDYLGSFGRLRSCLQHIQPSQDENTRRIIQYLGTIPIFQRISDENSMPTFIATEYIGEDRTTRVERISKILKQIHAKDEVVHTTEEAEAIIANYHEFRWQKSLLIPKRLKTKSGRPGYFVLEILEEQRRRDPSKSPPPWTEPDSSYNPEVPDATRKHIRHIFVEMTVDGIQTNVLVESSWTELFIESLLEHYDTSSYGNTKYQHEKVEWLQNTTKFLEDFYAHDYSFDDSLIST